MRGSFDSENWETCGHFVLAYLWRLKLQLLGLNTRLCVALSSGQQRFMFFQQYMFQIGCFPRARQY